MDTIKKLVAGSDIEFIDSLLDFTEKVSFLKFLIINVASKTWEKILQTA